MFTKMTLAGLDCDVPNAQVDHYLMYGWKKSPGADQTKNQPKVIKKSITPKTKTSKKKI